VELGRREEAEGLEIASGVVVNDDLDQAVRDLAGIVGEFRRREQSRP
jgi:hypothetical protein